jgi:hypothetical protein
MIGDVAKKVLMEDTVKRTLNPRILVSKTEKVPSYGDNPVYNKDLFFTRGQYSITFRPYSGQNKVEKTKLFLINCDLFPKKVRRVGSYRMMEEFAKKEQWIYQFLIKWTTLTEYHFEIATKNIGIAIPFCFKADEYYKMLVEKKKSTGTDTDVDWELFREDGMNEYESRRLKRIKDVIWQLPVEIEV